MSDVNRIYPRQAFVLTPTMLIKEVTVERKTYGYSLHSGYDTVESGKSYHYTDLHPTREAAIAAGRAKNAATDKDIKKRQETLAKRQANLDKAEGK